MIHVVGEKVDTLPASVFDNDDKAVSKSRIVVEGFVELFRAQADIEREHDGETGAFPSLYLNQTGK